MAYDPADATTALSLLEDALALETKPTLEADQVDRAFGLASSLDADSNVVYLAADLNQAAAWGWGIKAGMTADKYDLGAGTGITLKRSQWQDYCLRMAGLYRSGALSVAAVPPVVVETGRVISIDIDYLTIDPFESESEFAV